MRLAQRGCWKTSILRHVRRAQVSLRAVTSARYPRYGEVETTLGSLVKA